MLGNRIDDEAESAGHHLIEREALVDTMVGDPVLREVVGADPLTAVSGAHQPPPLGRPLQPRAADLPDNHLAYAGQWFLFALTALVIYGLVLRQKLGLGAGRRNDRASPR